MARHAIVLAVVEIRYEAPITAVDQSVALAVREALRKAEYDFPVINKAVQGELTVEVHNGQAKATTTEEHQGWELVDPDRQMSISLAPDRVAIQTQLYDHYSATFLPVLEALLPAVQARIGPELRHRVGLRYVNRYSEPAVRTPADWDGLISDWLLGPVANNPLAATIRQAHQQLVLAADDGLGAVVRHGPFDDPATGGCSYLWDLDVYNDSTETFAPAALLQLLRQANIFAAKTWKASVTSDYLKDLGIEDKSGEEETQ